MKGHTMHSLKVITITLLAVLVVEFAVVGAYLSQAPKAYKCVKVGA